MLIKIKDKTYKRIFSKKTPTHYLIVAKEFCNNNYKSNIIVCFKRPSLDVQMLVTYKSASVQEHCVLDEFQDATSAINYCNDINYKLKEVFSAEKIMKSLLQDVTSTTVESDDINDKRKEVFKARKIMQNLPLELFPTKLFI